MQRREHQTEFAGDEVDDGQAADERQSRETSRLHRPTAVRRHLADASCATVKLPLLRREVDLKLNLFFYLGGHTDRAERVTDILSIKIPAVEIQKPALRGSYQSGRSNFFIFHRIGLCFADAMRFIFRVEGCHPKSDMQRAALACMTLRGAARSTGGNPTG